MNILVLGNGFDLAHGLPTKYTDFLDWIKKYYDFYSYATRKRTAGYKESNEFILQYFNNLFYDESNKDVCDEIYNLVHENMWIDYFLENPRYQKENWIDFESEISRVIQSLDFDMSGGLIHYGLDDNMDKLSNEFLNKRYSVYSYTVRSVSALTENYYESITFRQIRDRLQKDLERLIRALELY